MPGQGRRDWRVLVATNSGKGYRRGAVTGRSQVHNPKTDSFVKRDTSTGRFMDGKSDGKPFKGVRREK
jgi:hypothetical protein